MNIYIFLGPPGVGKGSLSRLCVENFGWVQLSTGNLCRIHIENQTEIGKKIDFIIKSGKLVPDSLISEMVSDWILENYNPNQTIILDGYPRTITQAQSIYEFLEDKFSNYNMNLVKLVISEEAVVNRLVTRLICSNTECQLVYSSVTDTLKPKKLNHCDKCSSLLIKRKDDEEKSIKERLSIYSQNESDLLKFYNKIGKKIINLNVDKQLNDVFADFKKLIN